MNSFDADAQAGRDGDNPTTPLLGHSQTSSQVQAQTAHWGTPIQGALGEVPRSKVIHNVSVLRLNSITDEPNLGPVPAFIQEPLQDLVTNMKRKPPGVVAFEILSSVFPCLQWLARYKGEYLRGDVLAGITVGIMLVPQGMAYARVAGLDPQYGLYTGLVPLAAYAVFGSSRQLVVGPVSLVCMMVAEGLKPYEGNEEETRQLREQLAVLLALMVGVMKAVAGLLRMGWIVRFLSHSVVSGFTSGAACMLFACQVVLWMDCGVRQSDRLPDLIRAIYSHYAEIRWPSFTLGLVSLMFLLVMKNAGKAYRHLRLFRAFGPLLAVILSTILVWKIGIGTKAGTCTTKTDLCTTTIGSIPPGLPRFRIDYPWDYVQKLFVPAFVIIGVGCIESISIAKALAAKNGYELDHNQELLGLGLSNVLGSAFRAIPSYGSFSRSAVNDGGGAQTPLASLVTAVVVMLTLQYLTPLFMHLPMSVLGSIIMSSMLGLIDYPEAFFLLKVDRKDFLLWMLAFLGTMFLGVQVGVVVSVTLSLAFVVNESANPHTAILGRLPGTTVYRNVEQYPEAITKEGIVVIRIDAPIYFANVSYLKDYLRKYERSRLPRGPNPPLQYIIIQMSPVSAIDASGCHALGVIYQEYKMRDIQLVIVNPNKLVLRTLERAGIPQLIGWHWFFVSVHDAVQVCVAEMMDRPDSGSLNVSIKPAVLDTQQNHSGEPDDVRTTGEVDDSDTDDDPPSRLPGTPHINFEDLNSRGWARCQWVLPGEAEWCRHRARPFTGAVCPPLLNGGPSKEQQPRRPRERGSRTSQPVPAPSRDQEPTLQLQRSFPEASGDPALYLLPPSCSAQSVSL